MSFLMIKLVLVLSYNCCQPILQSRRDPQGGGGGGQVLSGIWDWGVPTGSPNPDPTSDQNMSFPYPFSDLTSPVTNFPLALL